MNLDNKLKVMLQNYKGEEIFKTLNNKLNLRLELISSIMNYAKEINNSMHNIASIEARPYLTFVEPLSMHLLSKHKIKVNEYIVNDLSDIIDELLEYELNSYNLEIIYKHSTLFIINNNIQIKGLQASKIIN